MENQPGNGATSPFGNGQGATTAMGASTGAHDFIKDPKSADSMTGGRDFSKENRAQMSGQPSDINADSVPTGGTLPYPSAGPNGGIMGVKKPFKLAGAMGVAGPMADEGASDGQVGDIPDEG